MTITILPRTGKENSAQSSCVAGVARWGNYRVDLAKLQAQLAKIPGECLMRAIALIEILSGHRQVKLCSRLCDIPTYEKVRELALDGELQGMESSNIHTQQVTKTGCEFNFLVEVDDHIGIIAMRFDLIDNNWLCTDLQPVIPGF